MNDRAVGLFEDESTAERARDDLVASGVESNRLTVKRVLKPGHRGLGSSETVHSLIHSPEIHDDDHVWDDAGTVILIVEMAEESETGGQAGVLDNDNDAVMRKLEELGATETHIVEATPPLDL